MKTPPPPKFGEPLEEDFWDPNEEFYNDEKAKREMANRRTIQGLPPVVPSRREIQTSLLPASQSGSK